MQKQPPVTNRFRGKRKSSKQSKSGISTGKHQKTEDTHTHRCQRRKRNNTRTSRPPADTKRCAQLDQSATQQSEFVAMDGGNGMFGGFGASKLRPFTALSCGLVDGSFRVASSCLVFFSVFRLLPSPPGFCLVLFIFGRGLLVCKPMPRVAKSQLPHGTATRSWPCLVMVPKG